jgi:predicted dehydrogenase
MHAPRLTFVMVLTLCFFPVTGSSMVSAQETPKELIRIGIIGLDTSHCIAFTKLLNDEAADSPMRDCRVVCAFPRGSADIESSVSRIPTYTKQIQDMGVEIVDSIDALISRVDAVLLETNDGRPHLQQVLPVLKAKKPVFIDKPIAGSLTDTIAIFKAADHFQTPVFSSSSLRFSKPAIAARKGELVGRVVGCETFSPASLEPTHPDLYWYGIHGVEQLFTVMGSGCESVSRTSTESTDVVVGVWSDGRVGSFRGTRSGPNQYGGTVFGEKGQSSTGGNEGYNAMVTEIAMFFRSGNPPVEAAETIEIYAFMSAADASKQQGGSHVKLKDVKDVAEKQAWEKLREMGVLTSDGNN